MGHMTYGLYDMSISYAAYDMKENMINMNLILATRTILVSRNIFNVDPKLVDAPKMNL